MPSGRPRVLGVFAHPDDAELTCFGTLASVSAAGADVSLLFLSMGERSRSESAAERASEAHRAAAVINATLGVEHLRDGAVPMTHETFSLIEDYIDRIDPLVILTHFDRSGPEDHQDHQAVGRIVTNLALRYSNAAFVLQIEPPVAGSGFIPNTFVDITRFIDQKLAAVACYASESEKSFMSTESVRARGNWWARQAEPGHADPSVYYEAFVMVRTRIARLELAALLAGVGGHRSDRRQSDELRKY